MRLTIATIVNNVSMASNITSSVIQLEYNWGYAVQANYSTSGTLGGTFQLQASCDYAIDFIGNVQNAGNWVTITNSPYTITGAGTYIWNIDRNANYPYARLTYTAAGGDTGTLFSIVTSKGT
jgi:hypothetical protein